MELSPPSTPLENPHLDEPQSNKSIVSIKTEKISKIDKIYKTNNKKSISESTDLNINNVEISKDIKIYRIKTSNLKLSSIDLINHYFNQLIPNNSPIFKKFKSITNSNLLNLLDLNISNNKKIIKLKNLNSIKLNKRKNLYMIKNKINDNYNKLEKLRQVYQKLKQKSRIDRKIESKLIELNNQTEQNQQNINENLNNLNPIFDPNWGLFDKLKQINEKLNKINNE